VRSQENRSLINETSMRHQHARALQIQNKIVVDSTVVASGLCSVFICCFILHVVVFPYCKPNWGHLNSLNDFLSSACALHDPGDSNPFPPGEMVFIAACGQFVLPQPTTYGI